MAEAFITRRGGAGGGLTEDEALAVAYAANPTNSNFIAANDRGIMGLFFYYLAGTAFTYKDLAKMTDVANSASAMGVIVGSQVAMEAIAASQFAMEAFAENSTASTAIAGGTIAMNIISVTTLAQDIALASTVLMSKIGGSSMASAKLIAALAGLDPTGYSNVGSISGSSSAISAVAASTKAMQVVVKSSSALSNMTASTTAMNALADNTVSRGALLASSTAMAAVYNVQMAIAKLAAGFAGLAPGSYSGVSEFTSNSSRMGTITNSIEAVRVIVGSVATRTTLLKSAYVVSTLWAKSDASKEVWALATGCTLGQDGNRASISIMSIGTLSFSFALDFTGISTLYFCTRLSKYGDANPTLRVKVGSATVYTTTSAHDSYTSRSASVSSYSGVQNLTLEVQMVSGSAPAIAGIGDIRLA